MTNTITLPIETEEFKALLKSIQTRLNNLDDKKPTPIIKKKMPFMPNMLVSKMIMMARPTYPYVRQIKDMVEELKIFKTTKHTYKRLRTGENIFPMWKKFQDKELTWFNEYHYYKHYHKINDFLNFDGYDELADCIFEDLVGHDYKWDTEQIHIMKKVGLGFKDENERGYAKKYQKTKLADSINEWLLDGRPGKPSRPAFDRFKTILADHVAYVFRGYRHAFLERSLSYVDGKHTKNMPFFFNFKASWFPLQIEVCWYKGRVYIRELEAHGEDYYGFHN